MLRQAPLALARPVCVASSFNCSVFLLPCPACPACISCLQVLQDMQEDPKAAQTHMRHPDIAQKVEKLVAAGIIQIR